MSTAARVIRFPNREGAVACQPTRPRILHQMPNRQSFSHVPPPVELSAEEFRVFGALALFVGLTTEQVARETGTSPAIGNDKIKERLWFIADKLIASERAVFRQAVKRWGLDAILDHL